MDNNFKNIRHKAVIDRFNPDMLKSLIENSQDENLRIKYIKYFKKLGLKDSKTFKFLENLLISDSNETIRRIAFKQIILINSLKAIKPVIYAINNEIGTFLINLIEFLSTINPLLCKKVLIKKVRSVEKKIPKILIQNHNLNKLNLGHLKEILNSYQFIQSLDALYFHRHTVPLALDFYGIE